MTLADLTAIARDHHTTGCYAGCHLRVGAAVWAALRASAPRVAESPLCAGTGLLLSLPVILDDGAPAGVWRLVAGRGETVLSGTLAAERATAEETP